MEKSKKNVLVRLRLVLQKPHQPVLSIELSENLFVGGKDYLFEVVLGLEVASRGLFHFSHKEHFLALQLLYSKSAHSLTGDHSGDVLIPDPDQRDLDLTLEMDYDLRKLFRNFPDHPDFVDIVGKELLAQKSVWI